ncbi:nucleoside-diphosphate sugar epimerase/dehydratase [Aliikangiella maris]|uniref:Uncharacterized protein n=2 Tax=Aliikangiella maris TaxID=3162458 RepID=A0ABV2BPA1_9GAMM
MSRIFGHYIPRSLTILVLLEFISALGAFYIGVAIRFNDVPIDRKLTELFHVKAIVFALVAFISLIAVGLYLVLGTGKLACRLNELKRKSDWIGITLVGFLHLKGEHDEVDAAKVIRSHEPLTKVVTDYGIDEIIVAIEGQRKNYPVDEIIDCKMKGVQVTEISDFFEKRSGKI